MALARSVLALGLAAAPSVTHAITQELYTTNAVCQQRYCVNPVFPAFAEMAEFTKQRWYMQELSSISKLMDFCGSIVDYDVALPMPNVTNQFRYSTVDYEDSALRHDAAASRTYFYHLNGMGIEAWDHTDPMEESFHPLRPCARSVARMACFTFFPKANPIATKGQEVMYMKPCSHTCEEYVQSCGVECCDEGVQCVFDKTENAGERTTDGVTGEGDKTLTQQFQNVEIMQGYTKASSDTSLGCTGTSLLATERRRRTTGRSGAAGGTRLVGLRAAVIAAAVAFIGMPFAC